MGSSSLISCDPGLSGALAIFDISMSPALVRFIDTPITSRGKTGKNKIDCEALVAIALSSDLSNTRDCTQTDLFVLEAVHSMPSQGVSSSFNFGHSFGAVEMFGHMVANKVELVTPQAWKKHFGLIGTDKDEARSLALCLFPHMSNYLGKKKHSGRADAALIGQFAIECLIHQPNLPSKSSKHTTIEQQMEGLPIK